MRLSSSVWLAAVLLSLGCASMQPAVEKETATKGSETVEIAETEPEGPREDRIVDVPDCAPLSAPYFGPCQPAWTDENMQTGQAVPPRKGMPYFGERLPQMPPSHFAAPIMPERTPTIVKNED